MVLSSFLVFALFQVLLFCSLSPSVLHSLHIVSVHYIPFSLFLSDSLFLSCSLYLPHSSSLFHHLYEGRPWRELPARDYTYPMDREVVGLKKGRPVHKYFLTESPPNIWSGLCSMSNLCASRVPPLPSPSAHTHLHITHYVLPSSCIFINHQGQARKVLA